MIYDDKYYKNLLKPDCGNPHCEACGKEPLNARPDWDRYFLNIAKAVSERATCLRARYGAIIVRDNVIVSTGYNGSARGQDNCTDVGECERKRLGIPSGERYELCKSVHAEANAIINGDPDKMKGATIYIYGTQVEGGKIVGQPCMMCHRMIVNAQIERIVMPDG